TIRRVPRILASFSSAVRGEEARGYRRNPPRDPPARARRPQLQRPPPPITPADPPPNRLPRASALCADVQDQRRAVPIAGRKTTTEALLDRQSAFHLPSPQCVVGIHRPGPHLRLRNQLTPPASPDRDRRTR